MGLFDRLKGHKSEEKIEKMQVKQVVRQDDFVDSSSIAEDERSYYQEDSYYTFYTYPNTEMAVRVVPFEERKTISYPTTTGLYVAEVLLLHYCSKGKYPKPKGGYPGLWWFAYGIRDVGHALESLLDRGYLTWASKAATVSSLKVEQLKEILEKNGQSTSGKKADLVERVASLPDTDYEVPGYIPKYALTEKGELELLNNGYIPYMHNHSLKTVESAKFGEPFCVWSINKLFPNGSTTKWKETVAKEEERQFGYNLVYAEEDAKAKAEGKTDEDYAALKEEMRKFLKAHKEDIARYSAESGDSYDLQMKGIAEKRHGNDQEALIYLYSAIEKKFDAPALYYECASILHKYHLYQEEKEIFKKALKTAVLSEKKWEEVLKILNKLEELIQKEE